ncbi:leucine-rich repeat serine/threonine-protein kinase 1-like [Ptychodera flava]|uniref:leucine-rich repeat serine/threonine-protein kinase 1-like n=1 Tax=Ptychodera flava TaxID=63121 RepID=UPI003969D857
MDSSRKEILKEIEEQVKNAVDEEDHARLADAFRASPHIKDYLQYLLPLKGKVSDVDHSKYDFLHLVCEKGNTDILLLFLAMDVDVDYATHQGTPLCVACRYGHLDIVRRLLEHDADFTKASPMHGTPLYIATRYGYIDIVDLLVTNCPGLIESKTNKDTMLHAACLNGSMDLVQYWIEQGADVDGEVFVYQELTADHPQTPLEAACESGNLDLAKYLIGDKHAGITMDVVRVYGEFLTPIMQESCRVLDEDVSIITDNTDDEGENIEQGRLIIKWNRLKLHSISDHWFKGITNTLVELKVSCNAPCLKSLPSIIPWGLQVLEALDISHNSNLKALPYPAHGIQCHRLKTMNASHNSLTQVPVEVFQVPSLVKLSLSHNNLTSLEDKSRWSRSESGHFEEVPDSRDSCYEDVEWNCPKLTFLDVSHNSLKRIPKGIQSATNLTKLLASNNKLKKIPDPWSCPLRYLDVSSNKIKEVPNDIGVHWTKTMEMLNLSKNNLHEIPWGICQLGKLSELVLAYNKIEKFPSPDYWHCSIALSKLDVSFNKLTNARDPEADCTTPSPPNSSTSPEHKGKRFTFPGNFRRGRTSTSAFHVDIENDGDETKHIIFPSQFSHSLDQLMLNNNNLQSVPPTICTMDGLTTLDLSCNPGITRLPEELGKLQRCWNLRLEGLTISNLPSDLQPNNPNARAADILAHLKAQRRKSEPYYRMKLMVVGLQNQGKTSLLAVLRGLPLPRNVVTNGIVIDEWRLPDQNKSSSLGFHRNKNLGPEVIFSTWDLAGQSEYYITHQCFLTTNTLYLAVFNVSKGEDGLKDLEPWLLNIQARAPESHVILVGTHVDTIPQDKRKRILESIHLKIATSFVNKKGRGFPFIVAFNTVSCTTGVGIMELKKEIYNRVLKIPNRHSAERLIGRKVPRSYLLLQEEVVAEVKRRSADDPPVLTEEEFDELAKRIPDNDIDTAEDLQLAANFLHETGQIIHFNDQMRDLNTLYFIDPLWLCNFLARVITVRAGHHLVMAGKMNIKKMEWLFHDTQYPKELIGQYLQLLERFEIALAISKKEILIPSMLPKEKPGFSLEPLPKLLRYYKMSYVPSGFWSRLITRLIVNIDRLVAGNIRMQNKGTQADLRGFQHGKRQPFSRNNSWNESRRYSSRKGFRLRDKKMIYWREGIMVSHRRGYFVVESHEDPVLTGDRLQIQEGIKITVASSSGNFNAMGFLVDHIDNMIIEWFPGLEDRDHEGELIVQRRIPCPYCGEYSQASMASGPPSGFSTDTYPSISSVGSQSFEFEQKEFTLEECARVAVRSDEITCEIHPDRPVPLVNLVPDILLCDLPKKFMVDGDDLVFEAKRDQCLGVGGAAIVFRGRFNGRDIAIKEFHATKNRTFSDIFHDETIDSGLSTSSSASSSSSSSSNNSYQGRLTTTTHCPVKRALEGMAAIQAFKELRSEVSLLSKLHHPCIVQLIGISLRPICFGLELAPMGSLQTIIQSEVMKKNYKTRDITKGSIYGSLLDRVITFKIALQVAKALAYLHANDIIYCDLKSDNVLVWSLDIDADINAKVSDYGISRVSSLQGVKGSDGTPGFQAPEVRPGMTYNEKADIFSYAMLLYETVCGRRPYEDMVRTVEITKAIRKGIRPSFQQFAIQSNFPELENLMKESWNANHILRPSARAIVKRMNGYNFLCRTNDMSMVDVKSMLYTPTSVQGVSSHTVWFWCRNGHDRRYCIIDVERGIHRMLDRTHVGSTVNCSIKVNNTVWIGDQDGKIEAFGVRGVGMVECIWTKQAKAPICAFATQILKHGSKTEQCVYVAQAKGLFSIYCRSLTVSQEGFDELPSEGHCWKEIKSLCLGLEEDACRCSLVVKNEQEVWVSCGSAIVVINPFLRLVEQRISHELLKASPEITLMQYYSHTMTVWCCNSKSSKLVEIDVLTKRVTRVLDLSSPSVGMVTALSVESYERKQAASNESGDIDQDDDITARPPSFPGSPFHKQSQGEPHADISDDVKSMTFPRSTESELKKFPHRSFNRPRVLTQPAQRVDSHRFDSRDEAQTITSMTVVKDTLWIGRNSGSVVVVFINTSSDHNYQYGQVLAQFQPQTLKGHRAYDVNHIIEVGIDRVAVCTEYQSIHNTADVEENKVSVFERWGSEDFALFDRIHEQLRHAEERRRAEEKEDEDGV